MMRAFELDGVRYEVDLVFLERGSTLPLTEHAGYTLDGKYHWQAYATSQYYQLRFRAKPEKPSQLSALWEQLQQSKTHSCLLPGGADMESMEVYVESCRQGLMSSRESLDWGELEVRFRVISGGEST